MTTPEKEFERELELFRTECESAAQFFFGYMAIHEVAKRRRRVYQLLSENTLFWNTAAGAMQTAAIIAIGRIFDQGSPHNIDKVLRLAQNNPGMFSVSALGRRKQDGATSPPSWLPEYLANAYIPRPSDFRRLRSHVKARRRIYEANYRELRHRIYAHREVLDESEIAPIVAKTSVREIERLLLFLLRFHESMWHLFNNGRKPTLRRLRYSVDLKGRLALPRTSVAGVHRRMVQATKQVLTRAAAEHERGRA